FGFHRSRPQPSESEDIFARLISSNFLAWLVYESKIPGANGFDFQTGNTSRLPETSVDLDLRRLEKIRAGLDRPGGLLVFGANFQETWLACQQDPLILRIIVFQARNLLADLARLHY